MSTSELVEASGIAGISPHPDRGPPAVYPPGTVAMASATSFLRRTMHPCTTFVPDRGVPSGHRASINSSALTVWPARNASAQRTTRSRRPSGALGAVDDDRAQSGDPHLPPVPPQRTAVSGGDAALMPGRRRPKTDAAHVRSTARTTESRDHQDRPQLLPGDRDRGRAPLAAGDPLRRRHPPAGIESARGQEGLPRDGSAAEPP